MPHRSWAKRSLLRGGRGGLDARLDGRGCRAAGLLGDDLTAIHTFPFRSVYSILNRHCRVKCLCMPLSSALSTLLIALAAMLWGGRFIAPPAGSFRRLVAPARVVLGEHILLALVFLVPLLLGRREVAKLGEPSGGRCTSLLGRLGAGDVALHAGVRTWGRLCRQFCCKDGQPVFTGLLAGRLLGERRGAGFWGWCGSAFAGAAWLPARRAPPTVRAGGRWCTERRSAPWARRRFGVGRQ